VGNSPYLDVLSNTVEVTEAPTEEVDPNKIIFENTSVDTKSKYTGDLILVNEDYQYYSGDEDLVSINEMLEEEEITCYQGYDYSAQVRRNVYTHLTDMLVDFNKATNYDDVLIEGAYRTNETQQALYDEDLAATGNDTSDRVALPGHSEHECGYALDFGINADGVEYDGTGEYDWINKNCWKYGFILRYTEDKSSITKIQSEPWHYRYVGVPHAYYMYSNNLCLEEYIELLKSHSYDGEHLTFADDNGVNYEIYYVASDDGAETTTVPVPSDRKYEISGNNSDGFIVTVYTDEKIDKSAAQETTAAAATEADEDENTDDSEESENTDESEEDTDTDEEDSGYDVAQNA
jgi:D-alanyl-D-alanine carboxypeptidase